jgi:hypothetical protein
VVAAVAERTGHAAAAGVEVGHRGRRNARQQRGGRRGQAQRALVAVGMEQDRRRAGPQGKRGPPGLALLFQELLEEDAPAGDEPGALAGLAAQQVGRILTHRRQAARFEEDQGLAAGGGVMKRVGVGGGHGPRFGEQAL